MPIPKDVLEIVRTRALGNCEICGTGLAEGEGSPHHRLLKSRGGKDVASNLIMIHHTCHMAAHANPRASEENGRMIPSWGETLKAPFIRPDGFSCTFDDEGGIIMLQTPPMLF
jgi:hypothetical protein